MKKLLLLGFTFLLSICSINLQSQTIQNVSVTSPILCFGDFASINIQVNQTSPPTLLKVVVGYDIFGTFIPITSTNNTTVTNINAWSVKPNYTVRLVDLHILFPTNNTIYDFTTINISTITTVEYSTQNTH